MNPVLSQSMQRLDLMKVMLAIFYSVCHVNTSHKRTPSSVLYICA